MFWSIHLLILNLVWREEASERAWAARTGLASLLLIPGLCPWAPPQALLCDMCPCCAWHTPITSHTHRVCFSQLATSSGSQEPSDPSTHLLSVAFFSEACWSCLRTHGCVATALGTPTLCQHRCPSHVRQHPAVFLSFRVFVLKWYLFGYKNIIFMN